MIIKLVTVDGINRKADRSISLRLCTTTEQTSQDLSDLDLLFQQTCMIALKQSETPFLDSELKELDSVDMDIEDTSKTPSKRLRNVLYILWEQGEKKDTFKEFYKLKMGALIDHYKDKLI